MPTFNCGQQWYRRPSLRPHGCVKLGDVVVKAYTSLNYERGGFPVCEKISGQILSLPMYPQLSAEQQATVVREVLQVALDRASAKLESDAPTELAGVEVAA